MKSIIALTIATLFATSALAAGEPLSLSVDIADLDLATIKGQSELAKRIDRAATQICAAEVLSQSPDMIRAERRCIKAAKKSVEEQIASRTGFRAAAK